MATLTVHEFLSRLVAADRTRSAFVAQPHDSPGRTALGETGNTGLLQAASAAHHAPFGTPEAPVRTICSSTGGLGGTDTHAAVNRMTPFTVNGNYTMEFDLATADIFSQLGDVDELLRLNNEGGSSEQNTSVDNSNNSVDNIRQAVASGNQAPVASGNETEINGLVGDINTGDLNVGNVAGNSVSNVVAGNGVTDVVGGVEGGDVMGKVGEITGVGEVTGNVENVVTSMTDLGGVTNELPVDAGAATSGLVETTAPVTGAEGPVGQVAGDLTGGDLVTGLGL